MKSHPIALITALGLLGGTLSPAQPYPHWVALETGNETPESIITKAANVIPSPRQIDFHGDEFNCFIHFGPNTFSGVEWGSGKEDPSLFHPGDAYDTDQWCATAKAAGMKLMLITVKHHDGFCTWQTRYNAEFSVKASPWKNGKGDVLRDLSASCKKFGLKLGVYLSPADLHQIESATGLYGNGSPWRATTIPTDPASFSSDPSRVRAGLPPGAPTFTFEADDYNRYFLNQLYELLTEYGPIHEVWFDGAHPKTKGGQRYIKNQWFDMIRSLAPQAVIFGGPDVRWCGNEAGATRAAEWNVLPVVDRVEAGGDRMEQDLGSDAVLAKAISGPAKALCYLVPEIDTSIRAGWFWRDESHQSVRTADDVFDIYERTVGGNGVFLLNVPPGRDGLMGARDVACLTEVGNRIRETYCNTSLMKGATSPHAAVLDGDPDTFWQPGTSTGEFTVGFPEARTFNRVVLQEAFHTVGQRVITHALEARIDGEWKQVAAARTIGYKRILRFPAIATDAFRVRILSSRLQPTIASFSAHHYLAPIPSLAIRRNETGHITIQPASLGKVGRTDHSHRVDSLSIHYTTDGSQPTPASPLYSLPLDLPSGGHFKAIAMSGDQTGPATEVRIGILKTGWKIHQATSEEKPAHAASMAIDNDPRTFWFSSKSGNAPHPHSIVIDLGKSWTVTGFTYLPRQDKAVSEGMIATGEVSTSPDGSTWSIPEPFRFGNLVNDPGERVFLLGEPVPRTRFLRITSISGEAGNPHAAAAEIGVLGS
jgi:alpha-L-fucosidase